jgi:predicted ATP-grasp superfamily ATP-dependent carboligase
VVIKPGRSVGEANGRRAKFGVGYAQDAGALVTRLEGLAAAAYPVLLQERIVGPGAGVFVLTWGGELLAAFAHRRVREKPPSGGVSVLRESVPLDPTLLARSLGLLRRLEWDGVAMVEYKVGEDGTPYLMEINGRFWGSLQLAIDAGVDFPRLLVEAALGNAPTPVTSYRAGILTRWGWGDVDHLLAMWRHSREALALPAGAPGRWRTLRDFVLAFGPHVRGEVLRWSDPLPFVVESLDWMRRR